VYLLYISCSEGGLVTTAPIGHTAGLIATGQVLINTCVVSVYKDFHITVEIRSASSQKLQLIMLCVDHSGEDVFILPVVTRRGTSRHTVTRRDTL